MDELRSILAAKAAEEPGEAGILRTRVERTVRRRRTRRLQMAGVAAACGAIAVGGLVASDWSSRSFPLFSDAEPKDIIALPEPIDEGPAGEVDGQLGGSVPCFTLDGDVAIFPAGTAWNPKREGIVLDDGRFVAIGGRISGGGGYYPRRAITGTELDSETTEAAATCADQLGVNEVVLITSVN